ncbi:HIT domain-containing protein [Polycyclovorans algicola]|uniref:HIT domain-containing protein n=1 Tax=Polycyclovorans algicola TaxID=616992 RepID=UPI0004A72C58|nr:HIT domain-containing protein [Polycyclovorans algicola]
MPTFSIDPRLAADTLPLLEAALCSIRLMNDARYPWLILVPRRANLRELFELNDSDLARFWFESATVSRILMAHAQGEKLNVAALGNVVPQLHVHHVVRFASDAAWPAPVWGRHPSLPYAPEAARQRIDALRHDLQVLRA